jgi:nitroreductase
MSDDEAWRHFQGINERRRAIRHFDGRPLDVAAFTEVVHEALKAPSSGNLQPFELHVVTEPGLRAALAVACNGQEAARTASALVVVVSSKAIARRSLTSFEAGLDVLPEGSRAYHHKNVKLLRRFLRFAPFPLWGFLRSVVSLLVPVLSLLPFGSGGVRQWLARNSVYAAQTLMLAASARGFDTCPMEGFDALKASRVLGLPRGSVIPLIIAVGHRSQTARLEPRLRRPRGEALVLR